MRILPLSLSLACSPAETPAARHAEAPTRAGPADHAHGPGHFARPEDHVAAWNDPARDVWQQPDFIAASLEVAPGATVVDLGAGTGYLLPALTRAVGPNGRVIAADVEPAMLEYLRGAITREGWSQVTTHAASPDAPGLPPASVDGVVTLNVWHHLADRGVYASKVREVLRPGASFLVVDFLKEPTEGFGPPMEMRLTADEVAADLRAGGLVAEILPETLPRHYMVRGRRAL